jgi:hypothetical protein
MGANARAAAVSKWGNAAPVVRERVAASFRAQGIPGPAPEVKTNGLLTAIVGREPCGGRPGDPLRWHISLAGPQRVPTWDELTDAAHHIRPGVHFVVMVPPRSLWMNVHPHVLHLWETADAALVAEAHANALGQTPT